MTPSDYASHDAVGLAKLIAEKAVSVDEVVKAAIAGIEAVNPSVNAVVEMYWDRIEALDEPKLPKGPFRGVPFLIKDVVGHEAGRRIEFGSRLCEGMVGSQDTYVAQLFRSAGLIILGRSAAPEYSMAGATETAFYGNTSTPWKSGYSAGGSTGGGMAAVVAGMVPIAHGTDIAGSIRIPASHCGGVGLKPSRGRVSAGPILDEGGFGLTQNFIQAMTIRDAAAMLDWLGKPQPGDPFLIPKPDQSYSQLIGSAPSPLRVAWSAQPLMGGTVDPEIAKAVQDVARLLEGMGHHVVEETPNFDGMATLRAMLNIWFFGFDLRLEGYAKQTGRKIGSETLEPAVLSFYEYAKGLRAPDFMAAIAALNTARRQIGDFFPRHDVFLSPTTPQVSEPWGRYNLSKPGVTIANAAEEIYRPVCEFTLLHNVLGTPAISLPLAVHPNGLPIGLQFAAGPAQEHVILNLAAALEQARPWRNRIPPMHVSHKLA